MVDKPQEQERTIVFGNGNLAELGDCAVNYEKDTVAFVFRPSPKMRWRDNISDDDYDIRTNWIKKTYPRKYCQCTDPSPDFQTWILFCDYYGKPTDLTEKINQELLAKNMSQRNEILTWKKIALLGQLDTLKAINFPEERKTKMLEEMKKQKDVIGTVNPYEAQTQKTGGQHD